ncbi:MAG: riboflavin biosynthesis protein RibF [Bryobacterales bacterium]|nr:riboflavin biosynthesis protein RibF [Bryobacteraceae bacterium]MDW8131437.1 riboflavin biosynthesis protein RibF [Bryobacterales bacterium]
MSVPLRICRSLEEAAGFGPCALSIGNFDGVHAGHRLILRRVVELARERGLVPSALTFDPHPAVVVAPERAPRLLTTPEQRARLMAEVGIAQVLILPFTREFSRMGPEEFARRVLRDRLGVRVVVVGENFRFGYQHAGDVRKLTELGQQLGFATETLAAVRRRGRVVSSSEIRRLIGAGAVSQACRLLERPHAVEGPVQPGRGEGARRVVPTLNLAPAQLLLPAEGVYITRATDLEDGRPRPAVTNVGRRPTFDLDELAIETYLLEPPANRQPGRLRVEFLRRLRPEKKFPDAESLRQQILRDVQRARAFFRRIERLARKPAG